MYDYDMIVVGAGPKRSAAAEKCARFELKTLLLEKESVVCGKKDKIIQ